jgi:flagellar biosynthesis protein FlhG
LCGHNPPGVAASYKQGDLLADQAAKLREIKEKLDESGGSPLFDEQFSNIIAVSSGKGGVGKTNIVANLAYALIEKGKKVVVFDADFGLANIDIILGIAPKYNLKDVIKGEKNMSEIIVRMPNGLMIIPGSQGIEEIANLDVSEKKRGLKECMQMREKTDYLLVDTSAGIHKNVIDMILASGKLVVVTTPEPTSITDAYSLIKIVLKKQPDKDISLLVNNVKNQKEGGDIFNKLNEVLKKFLTRDIDYFGYLVYDNIIEASVRRQKPFYESAPHSHAAKCIEKLAERLVGNTHQKTAGTSAVYSFFKRLFLVR